MKKLHYNIRVTGRVQGVWFRKYTKDTAMKIGVKGFVINDLNGLVYVEAEGFKLQLDEFIDKLKIGSPFSRVSDVTYIKGVFMNFETFEIKR